MPIYPGSRYVGSKVTEVKTDDGEVRRYIHDREMFDGTDIGPGALTITVQVEEELDLYAHKLMGSGTRWWLLADTNELLFPLHDTNRNGLNDMRPFRQIRIPARELFSRYE